MPTIATHALTGLALGTVLVPARSGWRPWAVGAACAVLPDADVAGFGWGIPYGHLFGHRGLSHSPFFAALVAIAAVALLGRGPGGDGRRLRLGLLAFLATASHGLLDAMTTGGKGTAFLAPFSNERFFLPWRPIEVSPIGLERFVGARGLEVLASEARWLWLPCAVLAAGGAAVRLARGRPAPAACPDPGNPAPTPDVLSPREPHEPGATRDPATSSGERE